MTSKNFLPIAIDISNEKILIIGGGHTAWNKINILKRFSANLEVIALKVCDEIKDSGVPFRIKAYEKRDLNGYLMLYSCTNDPILNRQIVKDARQKGVLVNIHDHPALCQFVSPAIYQSGHLRIAVSSNGEDVYAAIRTRNIIREYFEKQPIRSN
ncbi:precorrin-2 dehydrogenase/sirohydrochlorin ferrochelatase family protein [Thermophagus sp. OGC60D27]|uniref:precorrin-2 dehydrogenase/sirohydrochlorin ferrochelatase family protein n=1 Tax=Thermophagus sp. OGC60D27 TaxID=3458415 RepID=UPI0040382AA6